MKSIHSDHYDVIVIGSGIGGLTTASLLARFGKKRVLVLESHFKLGGFTHTFRRKQYEWDVGVHYVGEMYPEAMSRKIMDLVTDGQVEWRRNGSPYERYIFPSGSFEVPDDPEAFQQLLIKRFPNERAAIAQYFKDIRKAQGWIARWFVSKLYRWPFDRLITIGGRRLALQTTSSYLSKFHDPLLQAILAAQWPDYGAMPHESAFGIHATVVNDYLKGSFYPIGGSQKIAESAKEFIESRGGHCLVNHRVVRIETDGRQATGVTALHKGKEITFHAPVVVSAAGVCNTFTKMLPSNVCHDEKEKVKRLEAGTSALILFLGLKSDPRLHGFDEANYWMYSRLDHQSRTLPTDHPGQLEGAFLSFSSLRDPRLNHHTAQIISFGKNTPWEKYSSTEWKKRGAEYEQLKEEVSQKMIDYIDKHLPGVRDLIDYYELSTPLTVESFTGHAKGMIYGQRNDPNRLCRDEWKISTSLKNFYLSAGDVGLSGVNGAMMGGVMTAAKLLGPFGLAKIFTQAGRR